MTTRRQLLKGAIAGGAGLALAMCTTAAPAPNPTGTTTAATGSPAPARPKTGGTLTVANGFDIGELDPTSSSGAVNSFYHQQMIDRLLVAGRDLKLQPGLAERWE